MQFNREQLKADMKNKGWSYRAAATRIGRSYQWICLVLNGKATSYPVLKAIAALPKKSLKTTLAK